MTEDRDQSNVASVLEFFGTALQQTEYDLKPGDGVKLTRLAVEWANAKAGTDPMLGSGEDVRAIFALAEGITIGAMAWRAADQMAAEDRRNQ